MESKPVYRTDLARRIEMGLLRNAEPNKVRRLRLARGLALAYAADKGEGQLAISRRYPQKPSEREVALVKHAFITASKQPVLLFKFLNSETLGVEPNRRCVVRLQVFFGKQGRLAL